MNSLWQRQQKFTELMLFCRRGIMLCYSFFYENIIQDLHSITIWQIYLKDLRADGTVQSKQYMNNLFEGVISIKRRKISKSMKMHYVMVEIFRDYSDIRGWNDRFYPNKSLHNWVEGEEVLWVAAKKKARKWEEFIIIQREEKWLGTTEGPAKSSRTIMEILPSLPTSWRELSRYLTWPL